MAEREGIMNELSEKVKKEMIVTEEAVFALKVVDEVTYVKAGEFVSLRKGLKAKIKSFFDPLCDKANQAHKALTAARKAELDKMAPGDQHLNKQMVDYNLAEEKKRKAEEDKLRREAEKKAEEELLAAALEAEESGDTEEAEEILKEPVFVPPPIVEKTVPKVAGQTISTTWKWRLKNINLVPRQYLKLDEIAINGVVRSLKGNAKIDGIEVYPESSMRGVRS